MNLDFGYIAAILVLTGIFFLIPGLDILAAIAGALLIIDHLEGGNLLMF